MTNQAPPLQEETGRPARVQHKTVERDAAAERRAGYGALSPGRQVSQSATICAVTAKQQRLRVRRKAKVELALP
jgi:hypothetical protein